MFIINIKGDVKNNTFNNVVKDSSVTQEKDFLKELYDALLVVQSRKHQLPNEDQKNEKLTDILRAKEFYTSDETRQGRSGSPKKMNYSSGELDIGIRGFNNSGNIISIIEAFELGSCGPKNNTVGTHITKLIKRYDTAGNQENFVVIYSTAKNFNDLWQNYKKHVVNKIFKSEIDFKTLNDNYFNKSDLRVGFNSYIRNGDTLKLYHLFVNMYIGY